MLMLIVKFGRGLLWAEGESHRRFVAIIPAYRLYDRVAARRQRKALSPAFSNAAIRRLTSVFYDSAYKVKLILFPCLVLNIP